MAGGRAASTRLRVRDAQKLSDGVLLSLRIGKYLNRWITIHFATGGLRGKERKFLHGYLKHARDWLAKRRTGAMSYALAFEACGSLHVHMLLHVPLPLWTDFLTIEEGWIENGLEECGGRPHPDFIHDKPVRHYEHFVHGDASARDYLKQLRRPLLYMLKGATRMDTFRFLDLSESEISDLDAKFFPSPQGWVCGRRVSVSQNLLVRRIAPSLHPDPKGGWLDDAERELATGRAAHAAALGGNHVLGLLAAPPAVSGVRHHGRP